MAPREVSFTVAAKNAATSVIKGIEKDVGAMVKKFLSIGGAITAALAGFSLGKLFKDSIQQAAEAERGLLRLQKAVENTGGNFRQLKPDIDAVISGLERTTTFKDDDLVEGLEALTLTSGDAKGAINALGLAADIARAKKMSLADAATLVGKVMAGETGMLKRYGIVVDENADAMEALQKRFRGFAETDGKTFLGTIERVRNAWEKFQQALGRAILSGDTVEGFLGGIIEKLAEAEKWLVRNEAAVANVVSALTALASFLTGTFESAVKVAMASFGGWTLLLEGAGMGFHNLALSAKEAFGNILITLGVFVEKAAGVLKWFGINIDATAERLMARGSGMVLEAQAGRAENEAIFNRRALELGFGSGAGASSRPGAGGAGRLPRQGGGGPTQTELDAADAGNAKLQALIEKIKEERAKVRAEAAQLTATTVGKLVLEVEAQFNPIIKGLRDAGDEATAIRLEGLRDDAIASARTLSNVATELEQIELTSKDAAEEYNRIQGLIDQVQVTLSQTTHSEEERARLNAEIVKLQGKQADLLPKITNASNGVAVATERTLAAVQATGRAIMDAVNGALQLAEAFGLVTAETSNTLRGIGQIARGATTLAASISTGNPVGIVASVLDIAGGIASLFNGRNEARERLHRDLAAWNESLEGFADRFRANQTALARDLEEIADFHDEKLSELRARRGDINPALYQSLLRDLNETTAAAIEAARGRAAQEEARSLAGLQERLAGAQGNEDLARQIRRNRELLEATDAERGILRQIFAAEDAGRAVDTGPGAAASRGLASLSYAHGDNLVTYARMSTEYLRDIRNSVVGGIGGPTSQTIGSQTITIGALSVDARGSMDPAQTTDAVARGVDAALQNLRRNYRAAAGAPRRS